MLKCVLLAYLICVNYYIY